MLRARTALIGLSTTAALVVGGLGAASAAPTEGPSTPVPMPTPEGQLSAYVVNVGDGKNAWGQAHRAVDRAEGSVVQDWPQVGVIVVHSTNETFRTEIVAAGGGAIHSVGATRTVAVKEGTPGTATGLTDAQLARGGAQGEFA
ncbi:MAG TPA: hypothetical protein VD814_04630, partial [Nocardioides sp.]|nr:hypothetical protein [Nocardioides sp.]